jgi:hypothetical protein
MSRSSNKWAAPTQAHYPLPKLEQHPLGKMLPPMEEVEFWALTADIQANGLREAITLHQGRVLDGWHRYRALWDLGGWLSEISDRDRCQVEPKFEEFEGNDDDARAYVISRNIRRRHLSAEQRRDLLVKLIAAQPKKSDRAIAREAGVDHKQVSRARKRGESTGAIAPVEKRQGADGKTRSTKKRAPKAKKPAPAQVPRAPAGKAPAPPPSERSDILVRDAWWAVAIANNNIESARQIYALLTDDERRVAFTATLGRVINDDDYRAASIEVLARAIGEAGNDEDATASAEAIEATPTQTELSTKLNTPAAAINQWQVKFKKYPAGWFWSATSENNASMSNKPGVLFASQGEAEGDARAAIARAEESQPTRPSRREA